jgi:hypothetical protein
MRLERNARNQMAGRDDIVLRERRARIVSGFRSFFD